MQQATIDDRSAKQESPACSWPAGPRHPTLSPQTIHVWCAALNVSSRHLIRLRQLLSVDEQARADRFKFDRHRNHFIVARGNLRLILSRYLALDPQELRFDYTPRGKPHLAPSIETDGPPLRFNLAHSHGLALYAVTRDQPLGIDIEAIRPIDAMEQIAKRFFSPAEFTTLMSLRPEVRPAGFFNCWTRKEAFIKATGEGLSRALDQFAVTLKPDEPVRLVTIAGSPYAAAEWTLAPLNAAPGYAGALAIRGRVWQISCWCWKI